MEPQTLRMLSVHRSSWKEDNPVTTSAESSAHCLCGPGSRTTDGDAISEHPRSPCTTSTATAIREGNTGQKVAIRIDDDTGDTFGAEGQLTTPVANVNRNGTATRRVVTEDGRATMTNVPGCTVHRQVRRASHDR